MKLNTCTIFTELNDGRSVARVYNRYKYVCKLNTQAMDDYLINVGLPTTMYPIMTLRIAHR